MKKYWLVALVLAILIAGAYAHFNPALRNGLNENGEPLTVEERDALKEERQTKFEEHKAQMDEIWNLENYEEFVEKVSALPHPLLEMVQDEEDFQKFKEMHEQMSEMHENMGEMIGNSNFTGMHNGFSKRGFGMHRAMGMQNIMGMH